MGQLKGIFVACHILSQSFPIEGITLAFRLHSHRIVSSTKLLIHGIIMKHFG